MFQILQQRPPALDIRAGSVAQQLILKDGLHAAQVDVIPGAAGGPKGLGLQGLDRAIFTEFLPQSPQRRTLIGASIGSWRFASIRALVGLGGICQWRSCIRFISQIAFWIEVSTAPMSSWCLATNPPILFTSSVKPASFFMPS